jgi:hypothetical protein
MVVRTANGAQNIGQQWTREYGKPWACGRETATVGVLVGASVGMNTGAASRTSVEHTNGSCCGSALHREQMWAH